MEQPERQNGAGSTSTELSGRGPDGWEARVAAVWARLGQPTGGAGVEGEGLEGEAFVRELDGAVAELPGEHPYADGIAAFERAAARDSTGRSDLAIPLYREALASGLGGERRRRAVIQLASSLRNLGRSAESIELLEAERAVESTDLDDAVVTVLALALADVGREREGLALAIGALAPHLPRYQRSMASYARLLIEPEPEPDRGQHAPPLGPNGRR